MSIPLDLARTLAVVVEEGTLEAAARRLHVTPSAVSQRVRALEDQLGRVVLVRSKPVRTTEAGDAVVRLARQLALLEHDALAAIGGEGGVVASVPLAVNADSLGTWFLPPLARVAARRPVVFDLHRDDQDFTAGLLETGTVMAAVTSRQTPVAGCRVRRLGVLRYEAVATTPFVARWFAEGVDADALSRAPVVDFDRRDDLQTQWLARRGVPAGAPPRHRVPASQDFATAVELGLGWGLLPRFPSASGLAAGSLVRLGDDPLDVPLFWQQWNLTSALLDDVADEVVAEGRRVLATG
ncbi:LysR family transcriptional regulator ArgP [Microbacterium trichothecenolyticum]|uniref:LysR family transcriptional regulator (Chromosome initiation inhibitor) n=1 Tax=Microbacterium trichothecenolyticum TaxID=69370 RepID=A0ABU0TYD3_MICTR|nr:LysR family transcriptional regulator ArgP [Microbacterium trichothecenolyticum]MDQ1124674.1 LysR family transcriptional regulator (chromosome initiation inhibitor) [Microbacterium trichothecenolyticum]